MRAFLVLSTLSFMACSSDDVSPTGDPSTATGSGSVTGTAGATSTGSMTGTGSGMTCSMLMDGPNVIDGTAFGMPMGATVTMDMMGCSFTLTDWDMAMSSHPESGTIVGDQVTLGSSTDVFWEGCTGSVSATGHVASGACDDGTTWSITPGAMTGM